MITQERAGDTLTEWSINRPDNMQLSNDSNAVVIDQAEMSSFVSQRRIYTVL